MAHWFALYYLPPADDELYRLGSAVLGYDVRAGKSLEPSPGLFGALGGVPDAWVADARDFGFHLTVTEAMTYEPAGLSRIADEIAEILRSFDPASELSLTFDSLQRWRGEQVWVLRYAPSRALDVLQAVLVARLSLLGQSSMFLEEIERQPELYPRSFERQRLETFLSPRGLDTWEEHFTLLNPHPPRFSQTQSSPALVAAFERMFGGFERLQPASFCLVCKEGDAPWRLHREYPWPPRASRA